MTIIKRLLATLAVAVLGIGATIVGAEAQSERYGTQKAVYHINYDGGDEDKAYLGALRNVQNHLNAVGVENIELRVVLHGNGVNLLADALTN